VPWQYDDQRQEFTTPTGVVTLQELAALRYGLATAHVDLAGPWTGWRIRGALLKSPRGVAITVRPEIAAQFARWLRDVEATEAASYGLKAPERRALLRIVK
jgi:hypothetical protein